MVGHSMLLIAFTNSSLKLKAAALSRRISRSKDSSSSIDGISPPTTGVSGDIRSPRPRPRRLSRSLISASDFGPRLRIWTISPSVLLIRSPIVRMFSFRRQLLDRADKPSSTTSVSSNLRRSLSTASVTASAARCLSTSILLAANCSLIYIKSAANWRFLTTASAANCLSIRDFRSLSRILEILSAGRRSISATALHSSSRILAIVSASRLVSSTDVVLPHQFGSSAVSDPLAGSVRRAKSGRATNPSTRAVTAFARGASAISEHRTDIEHTALHVRPGRQVNGGRRRRIGLRYAGCLPDGSLTLNSAAPLQNALRSPGVQAVRRRPGAPAGGSFERRRNFGAEGTPRPDSATVPARPTAMPIGTTTSAAKVSADSLHGRAGPAKRPAGMPAPALRRRRLVAAVNVTPRRRSPRCTPAPSRRPSSGRAGRPPSLPGITG